MAANDHNQNGDAFNPMHQFEIMPIINAEIGQSQWIDISFTNASLWMLIAFCSIAAIMMLAPTKLIPGRIQSIAEIIYEFVADITQNILGTQGRPFFPFIFTLFSFILACNMLGMIPYSFTVTSHIAVTFTLAITVFIGATIIGFIKNGLEYFRLFLPKGVPIFLAPIILPIEVVSYFTRPISLSVRLFANMMAGHTMLKVFAGFVVSLGSLGAFGIGGIAPLLMMVALTGLEILIAFLQAYVFAVLTCIYINDALHPNH